MRIKQNSATENQAAKFQHSPEVWRGLSRLALGILTAGLLVSCGGGGANPQSDVMFSGTVAVGAALVGVTVEAACTGAVARSSPTDINGQYQIATNLNLPCTLSATDPSTGYTFRTIATSRGVANVTPLTDLVYQLAEGNPSRQAEATSSAGALLSSMGLDSTFDPTKSSFVPDETGQDKVILEFARIVNATSTTPREAYKDIPKLIASFSNDACVAYRTSLTAAGSTLGGTGFEQESVCPLLRAESRIREALAGSENSGLALSFFHSVMDEIGSAPWAALKSSANALGGEVTIAAIDTAAAITPYLLAEVIIRLDDKMLKKFMAGSGGKVFATKLRDAMRDGLKPTNPFATGKNFAQTAVSVVANIILDLAMTEFAETVGDVNAERNWALQLSAGVVYGSVAWGLEYGLNMIIDCAFQPKLCPAWKYANVISTTFNWIAKDVEKIRKINSINSEINSNAVRLSVDTELQAQRNELQYANRFGLISWATSGMTSDATNTVSAVVDNYKHQIMTRIGYAEDTAVCQPLLFELSQEIFCSYTLSNVDRAVLLDKQIRRLNNIQASWLNKISACKGFSAEPNKEVGVSLCLNLLNNNNAAPLSCASGLTLKNGQCKASPVVLSVQPGSAPLAQTSTFTITGTDFPATVVASIADASCGSSYNVTTTSFQISCKLAGTTGAKTVTVKTTTDANNGVVIDSTKTVTATIALTGVAHPTNGFRYEVISCASWAACKTAAQAKGAQLVTISSADLNAWLLDTFRSQASNANGFWIGLNQGTLGLTWASGQAVSYTNWNVGEPNNQASGAIMGNTGAHMYTSSFGTGVAGKWNDTSSTIGSGATSQAIIEYAP